VFDFQRQKASQAAAKLKHLLQPILLQRKKSDFEDILQLPEKLEVVVWVPLSSKQRGLYSKYLEGRQMEKILSQSTYPIEAVNYLKTLCRHPFLTEATIAVKQGQGQGQTGGGSSGPTSSVSDLAAAMGCMGINSRSGVLSSCSRPAGVGAGAGAGAGREEQKSDRVSSGVLMSNIGTF
jgi:SNF2 family DNA or RNA helicase